MHIELEPYTQLKLLRIVSKDLQPWSNLENDFTCCSPCERKPGCVLTNQHIEPSSRQDTFFKQKVMDSFLISALKQCVVGIH